MFGLTFEKLLLIGLIAVFILGPDRLPQAAATLARLVRQLKNFADGAKTRVRDEMGPEFDEVDWKKLDPRQYDPRRIIREALADEAPASGGVRPAPRVKPTSIPADSMASAAAPPVVSPAASGSVAFDTEAT
ncbi:MAG: twin-arginine translocase TatA/TatE family subunit [Naasia sp.]